MKYRLSGIKTNPFRQLDRYPRNPEKIARLRESIRATGFWDTLVAREGPDGPEAAFGCHRLEAAIAELGGDYETELIMRDLDDVDMIRIMASENMTEWNTSASVEMETVRVVVEAFGANRIELTAPSPDTPSSTLRFAPFFQQGALTRTPWEGLPVYPEARIDPEARTYTARTVAEFLGWLRPTGDPQNRVLDALSALELIEEGIFTDADYAGLSPSAAAAMTQQARQAKREQEAEVRRLDEEARQSGEAAQAASEQAEAARLVAEQKRAEAMQAAKEADERQGAAAALLAEQEEAQWRAAQAQRDKIQARAQAAQAAAAQARQDAPAHAAAVGRHVGDKLRAGEISVRGASQAAKEARSVSAPRQTEAWLDAVARRTAGMITRLVTEGELTRLRVQLQDNAADIPEGARGELTASLMGLEAFAVAFRSEIAPAAEREADLADVRA